MANRYLMPLYKQLYDITFNYSNFDHRMEMQKAVYLLQDMGVPVGDYGFRWYLHGPYSQTLQDDMYFESGRTFTTFSLVDEHAERINLLRELIHSEQRGEYSLPEWVECLASLHYLKKNVMGFNATSDAVVAELERRKSHLSNHRINKIAYDSVEGLFA